MKKLILFALTAMFLMSCGGEGLLPTDNITWGTAFNYCMTTDSYKVWLFGSILLLVGTAFYSIKNYRNGKWDAMRLTIVVGIAFTVFAACLFVRPSEIAANTTVEQFARGVVIGY